MGMCRGVGLEKCQLVFQLLEKNGSLFSFLGDSIGRKMDTEATRPTYRDAVFNLVHIVIIFN